MKKNLFNQVQIKAPQRSVFDLSHDVKMSLKMGILYPTLVMECMPGDKFSISCESLLRFQPLVAPVMHRIDVTMHYFFVPNRILWPEYWEKFITAEAFPGAVPPAHPYFTLTSGMTAAQAKDLTYFGLPNLVDLSSAPVNVNAFPFAAYEKIYYDYYRDQNLIAPNSTDIAPVLSVGDNTVDLFFNWGVLRRRAWEHDYFTSALPFAQKGLASDIPLGDVILKDPWDTVAVHPRFVAADGDPDNGALGQAADILDPLTSNITIAGNPKYAYNPDGTLTVEPTTINDLRRAFRLQEWLEKEARSGSRYIESILAHFGVRSSDARLQRAEYITGTKSPVTISEVLNTAATDQLAADGNPQGAMAGHGVSVTSGNYGKFFCEEHGFIIGIMSVMPKTAYQEGLHRMWSKTDKFSYPWPEFANLGEQAILNKEIHVAHGTPEGVFGYIPQYAEYKFMNNRTAGDMQTNLNFWTLTRVFGGSPPDLNKDFIECTPSTDIFAVTDPDEDTLIAHIYHKIRAIRPLPFYGTPTI